MTAKLPAPGLYAILDLERIVGAGTLQAEAEARQVVAYAEAAWRAGAQWLQLRAKAMPANSLVLQRLVGRVLQARDLRQASAPDGAPLPVVVNDHLEAARPFAGRPGLGLHVGQDDAPPGLVRAALGSAGLVGLSTHTLRQVREAAHAPVDVLGFGPVRPTTGKATPDAVLGLPALAEAAALSSKPLIAIGGLRRDDMAGVRGAGARWAAVIGAWLGPRDAPLTPDAAGEAMATLVQAWQAAGEASA